MVKNNVNRINRKAQVSVYVIIAIVIVLGAGLYVGIKNNVFSFGNVEKGVIARNEVTWRSPECTWEIASPPAADRNDRVLFWFYHNLAQNRIRNKTFFVSFFVKFI